jgi:hypothetical protein
VCLGVVAESIDPLPFHFDCGRPGTRALCAAKPAGQRAATTLLACDGETVVGFYSLYERFGFEPSPLDPLRPLLLIKDARKTFESP